jgi:DNA-binding CsgD family transcriptional regulator
MRVILLEPMRPRHDVMQRLVRYGLTPREAEVAIYVMRGLHSAEIAETLNITEQTVKDHLRAVFNKVEVKSRSELITQVFGLLSDLRVLR